MHSKERGILFDDTQGTYVTNTQLGQMMQGVSTAIGQPIDIVGMDACMMAMIEIGYQIKDYARYLVASENVEPGNGWNYAGFLGHLSVDSASWTPQRLASMIVQQYGIFYQGQDNSITMSALDLSQMGALKDNVNQLVSAIAGCSRVNPTQTRNLILTARNAAIEFDVTDYIDLYSFYNALATQISRKIIRPATKGLRPGKVKVDTVFSNAAQVVQTILVNGMQLIDRAVIANTAGSAFRTVRGLSIYFPRGAADPSYKYTKFAQDTSWDDFIATY
ncbi:hypothetical protein EBZ39_19385 [bacterium]|nr:hypothetical protein [bacterium]